jgi:ASC-1-like (ASCH) protein
MKKYTLPIRQVDREVYNLIKSRKKKVETRAAGPKYEHIQEGDILVFRCGADTFERRINKRHTFTSVDEMLTRYKPSDINPGIETAEELKVKYRSFPGYDERLKKYGILAFELE